MSCAGSLEINNVECPNLKKFFSLFRDQDTYGTITRFNCYKYEYYYNKKYNGIFSSEYHISFNPIREHAKFYITGDNFTLIFKNKKNANNVLKKISCELKKNNYNIIENDMWTRHCYTGCAIKQHIKSSFEKIIKKVTINEQKRHNRS